jgi:FlaA1/EpsC-like NDP-sugar epimerase
MMSTPRHSTDEGPREASIPPFAMRNRRWIVFATEVATICLSLAAAFLLRFEFDVPPHQQVLLFQGLGLALLVKFAAFRLAALERRSFRFTSLADILPIAAANIGGSVVFAALIRGILGPRFPRSIYFIDLILCFVGIAGLRLLMRLLWESKAATSDGRGRGKRILIYGAGVAGVTLLRRIRTDLGFGAEVVAFVDDDPAKRNAIIQGLPVSGSSGDLQSVIQQHRVDEIWVAAPSAARREQQRIVERCRATGLTFRIVPTLAELVTGSKPVDAVREISSAELMGRELVDLGEKRLESWLSRQRLIVTGAAGSIGSELCRQAAACNPRMLVAIDRSEGGLFEIERQFRDEYPELPLTTEIADITDTGHMAQLIARYRASMIYHAAAYKHVPLMERHILQAVENNALSVRRLLQAADELGVERFVLVSSDKAVRPSSVMGASKRLAELATCSFAAKRTRAMAVRFGNVLGSSGSLLPILRAQIAGGGPVTITHPEMTRFFMDLREAVSLVMQASFLGSGREIFVLDMGEPVRIVDLAERLIRLNGYEPERDIKIRFTEPRPGEKLHEELAYPFEELSESPHKKIRSAANGLPPSFDGVSAFRDLERRVAARDERGVLAAIEALIPEFTPSAVVRGAAEASGGAARRAFS